MPCPYLESLALTKKGLRLSCRGGSRTAPAADRHFEQAGFNICMDIDALT